MSTTPTPSTDAQPPVKFFNGEGMDETHDYVRRDFARQLERELAAMTKHRDTLAEALKNVVDIIHQYSPAFAEESLRKVGEL